MKQYVVAMVALEDKNVPTFAEFVKQNPEVSNKTKTKQEAAYIVMLVELTMRKSVKTLYTGKLYTLEEAEARAEELQKTCQPELNYLDFDRFVAYNVNTPKE